MSKKEHIVKYTDKLLADLLKREGTGSNWNKAAYMTKAQIEEAVRSDPDETDMLMD